MPQSCRCAACRFDNVGETRIVRIRAMRKLSWKPSVRSSPLPPRNRIRRDSIVTTSLDDRKRWLALIILCLGDLMIVLDATIVNVALPSIRTDLGFSETSLAWVVNAYVLTFGGFMLLGGRLGDLFGHRRLFLIGIS